MIELKRISRTGAVIVLALFILAFTLPGVAQHHSGNWIHRNGMDTTFVHCSNDSMTMVGFPPSSMMGMMGMPDSVYCRIDRMPMDSLHHPYDSTVIGWHRMQIGRDSMHFDMMSCDSGGMMGSHSMMQFSMNMQCRFHWDSTMSDSIHRGWHPMGLKGWNGSSWVAIPNIAIVENDAVSTTPQLYSAIAFVGEPAQALGVSKQDARPTGFVLAQNYPNPFNPTTRIQFSLPTSANVTLKVYNVLGNEVQMLINNQSMSAGAHTVSVDASNLASGIYFYTLKAGYLSSTKKMLLVR